MGGNAGLRAVLSGFFVDANHIACPRANKSITGGHASKLPLANEAALLAWFA